MWRRARTSRGNWPRSPSTTRSNSKSAAAAEQIISVKLQMSPLPLVWHVQTPTNPSSVNIPRNRKLVIVAYADGTIRRHRLSDGQELLALFVHAKDRRWVA